MKKIIAFLLVTLMCLSFAACGSEQSNNSNEQETTEAKESVTYYKLGDTVSTDIFEFTLNSAEFTIALNNVNDNNFFTPKEYDQQSDAKNPYVAPVGHTYAAFSYTVSNLNRASCEFHNGSFATVNYEGNTYNSLEEGAYYLYADRNYIDVDGKMKTEKAGEWYSGPAVNLRMDAGEKATRRAYVDVAADVKDLTADVEITFAIPNSDGSKTEFAFLVSETDRGTNNNAEIEMSLDLALVSFTEEDGQEYFKNHMNDYDVMSSDQIVKIANGKWNVNIKESYGSWSGTFWFQEDG